MKQTSDGFNLNYCNPRVSDIKSELERYEKIWVGFNEKLFFELDRALLDRFIENLGLSDDELIEVIF